MTEIDIRCDVQQIDATGYVWTLLDEARDPAVTEPDAIVISADEDEAVLARVVDLVPRGARTVVHLEILPGSPRDYAEALSGRTPASAETARWCAELTAVARHATGCSRDPLS